MAETPVQVVDRLYAKMKRRATDAREWSRLYDGEAPLKFASPEFSQMSGGMFDDFSDNWCRVVPDAAVERLVPIGFRTEDGDLDKIAWRAWRRNGCDVDVPLALLDALVESRAYGLVWKPGAETNIEFYSLSNAIVQFEPTGMRRRRYGLISWEDDTHEFATLFTPKRVFRFNRQRGMLGEWRAIDDRPNPMGVVPLVPLENRSRLKGRPVSELKPVAPLQNAVNTIWAHLMTASDAVALPARAVLGMDRPQREILDKDGEVVATEDLPLTPFRKDRLLWLEGDNASIGEFSAADLTNYTKVIEVAVQHIAAQTRTPPHYLLGQMINISADALTAAESGLVAKVTEYQRSYGASLREIMRLEAIASGEPERAEALALGNVVWRDAQFRSDAQYADALTKFKAIGVPDEALWEMIPSTDPDVLERWRKMRESQAAAIVGGDLAGMFGAKAPEADAPPETAPDDVPEAA